MATVRLHIPPPTPYWNDPSETPSNFRNWYFRFDNWLALTSTSLPEGQQLTDERKNRYLFQLLGEEGGRQFANQPIVENIATATYADFSKTAKDYFSKAIGIVRARFDFHTHLQGSHEPVSDYLTELRALSVDCRFGDKENEQLATQVAIGCYNEDAKKELLRKQELNLDDFVKLIESFESANSDLSVIQGSAHAITARVGAASSRLKPNSTQGKGVRSGGGPTSTESGEHFFPTQSRFKPCRGCGQQTHAYRSQECPAVQATCNYCNKIGHFARCCLAQQKDKNLSGASSDPEHINTVRFRQARAAHKPQVLPPDEFKCTMYVLNQFGFVPINAELDSGSDVTTVTKSDFDEHFGGWQIEPTDQLLHNFDGSPVTSVIGSFRATVCINDQVRDRIQIYVTHNECLPLIGKNLIVPLKLLSPTPPVLTVHSARCDNTVLSPTPTVLTVHRARCDDTVHQCQPYVSTHMPRSNSRSEHHTFLPEEAQPSVTKMHVVLHESATNYSAHTHTVLSEGSSRVEKVHSSQPHLHRQPDCTWNVRPPDNTAHALGYATQLPRKRGSFLHGATVQVQRPSVRKEQSLVHDRNLPDRGTPATTLF